MDDNKTLDEKIKDKFSPFFKTNEYTSTFDSTITTYTGKKGVNVPRTADVVANGKKDTFEYSISTFTKDEYNRYLINQIDVSVHHPWRSDEYYIRFDDKDDKVKIVSVSQDNTTFVTLIPTDDKHRYDLSEDDYDVINYNNTLFAGEYIEIIYEAHGIKYKAKYSEFAGGLNLKSLTQI